MVTKVRGRGLCGGGGATPGGRGISSTAKRKYCGFLSCQLNLKLFCHKYFHFFSFFHYFFGGGAWTSLNAETLRLYQVNRKSAVLVGSPWRPGRPLPAWLPPALLPLWGSPGASGPVLSPLLSPGTQRRHLESKVAPRGVGATPGWAPPPAGTRRNQERRQGFQRKHRGLGGRLLGQEELEAQAKPLAS